MTLPTIPNADAELTLTLTLTADEWALTAAALGSAADVATQLGVQKGGMPEDIAQIVQVAVKARGLIIVETMKAYVQLGEEHG